MDYWYDVNDPSKRHHPLITGAIKLRSAHNVIHPMLIVSFAALAVIAWLESPAVDLALLSLLGFAVFGHAYNDGMDKSTVHSWVPISACFTSLAAYGWFMSHSYVDVTFAVLMSATFSAIFFQIAVSGNLKDIGSDPVNLLRRLGCEGDWSNGIKYSGKAMTLIITSTSIKGGLITALPMIVFGSESVNSIITLVLVIAMIVLTAYEVSCRDRDRALKMMSLVEICTLYGMLYGCVEPLLATIIAVIGVAYFFGVNKAIWKVAHPKV